DRLGHTRLPYGPSPPAAGCLPGTRDIRRSPGQNHPGRPAQLRSWEKGPGPRPRRAAPAENFRPRRGGRCGVDDDDGKIPAAYVDEVARFYCAHARWLSGHAVLRAELNVET